MAVKKSWPFERIKKGRVSYVRVTCVRTGAHKEIRIKRTMNNYEVDKVICNWGFRLTGRGYELIKSNISQGKKKMTNKQTQKVMIAQVKLVQLLEQHFDSDNGCYDGGYSDERIAQETNLSIVHVKDVRCTCYGDLKVPDEIIKLREEFAALYQMVKDGLNKVEKLGQPPV